MVSEDCTHTRNFSKSDSARFELLRFDNIFSPVFILYCHFSAMSEPNHTEYGQDTDPGQDNYRRFISLF